MYRLEACVTLLYNIFLCDKFPIHNSRSLAGGFRLQAFVNCEQNSCTQLERPMMSKGPVITLLLTLLSLSMAYINEPQIRQKEQTKPD